MVNLISNMSSPVIGPPLYLQLWLAQTTSKKSSEGSKRNGNKITTTSGQKSQKRCFYPFDNSTDGIKMEQFPPFRNHCFSRAFTIWRVPHSLPQLDNYTFILIDAFMLGSIHLAASDIIHVPVWVSRLKPSCPKHFSDNGHIKIWHQLR